MTAVTTKRRSFWPMAILTYFILAIIGIAIFITFAVRQNMDLVRKDYYAEEIQFQQHFDQLSRTRELNWKPEVAYDRERDVVVISLTKALSISGKIQFYRPSDAALDHHVKLSLNQDGAQEIDARNFPNGLWKVRISWTADDEEFFTQEIIVIDRKGV